MQFWMWKSAYVGVYQLLNYCALFIRGIYMMHD